MKNKSPTSAWRHSMCWTMKVAAHGGCGHDRLSSVKAPVGQTLFASESASGQRAHLSGTAIAQASADPTGEQIQTLVAGPCGQIEYLGLSQRNVTE